MMPCRINQDMSQLAVVRRRQSPDGRSEELMSKMGIALPKKKQWD
jgi:hypothetical protein